MTGHTDENGHEFERFVESLPAETESYSVSGERDCVLKRVKYITRLPLDT